MNVLIFGGTGKTGSLVVDRALTRGHTVTVLVRDPLKFTRPNVRIRTGNATNPSDVLAAMRGQHAVIETIGGTTPGNPPTSKPTPSTPSSMPCRKRARVASSASP